MASLLLPLRWFSILRQKSLSLLLNFNLANLTLLAHGRHIWSKNWSISSSQLMRVHGSRRPSNIGASKTTMIHWDRLSTIWNEHGLGNLGFGWCSVLIIMWGLMSVACKWTLVSVGTFLPLGFFFFFFWNTIKKELEYKTKIYQTVARQTLKHQN